MTAKDNSAAIGSPIARKSAARLAAVQAVYQMGLNDQKAPEVIAEFMEHRLGKSVDGEAMVRADGILFEQVVRGLELRIEDAKELVTKALGKRSSEGKSAGVEPLLHAIMLCGTYELMAHGMTDAPVIISDYVNVAHSFYEDSAPQLVNGVLDTVSKAVRS
jgi:N utilization substance protein B